MDSRKLGTIAFGFLVAFSGGNASVHDDLARPATPTARPAFRDKTPAGPVELARLPVKGFAVQTRDNSVTFLDIEGDVVDVVRGFFLHGNVGNAGVWLERDRTFFRVDPARDLLRPVGRAAAKDRGYDEGDQPGLRPPKGTRYKGTVVGHWRYALKRADGATLAQWSGECEVPTAFWIDGTGTHIVTGHRSLAHAPESMALGWSEEGRALVHLRGGLCGVAGNPPGIYSFERPGDARLLYETPRHASVDMWGGGGR